VLDQIGNAAQFDAFYTASGVRKTGLTVTVNVRSPSGTEIVTGGSATEIGDGFYTYSLSNTLTTAAGNYRAVFITSDSTVDQKEIPSAWIIGKPWVQDVDGAISGIPAAVVTGMSDAPVGTVQDKAGYSLDLTQPLASVKTGTVGGALHGAWVAAWGKIVKNVVDKTLTVFGFADQVNPAEAFDLDDGSNPSVRTPR